MEVYLYGTANEVIKAQTALRVMFPESEFVLPVFDLPDTPEQLYCRVAFKCGGMTRKEGGSR